LRTYVSALRSLLRLTAPGSSTRVTAGPGGYRVSLAPADLDALVFEELAARGQKALGDSDPPAAARLLHQALGLWRGRVLEDVPPGAEAAAEVARLEELRVGALESWVEARLGLGQHAELATELRPAVAAYPLRERLHGLCMLALYRGGQQAEALAVFRRLRAQLVRELGIEPGPPLQRLQRQILAADPALEPPLESVGGPVVVGTRACAVPRRLPPDVAGFTGRDRELARLRELVCAERDRTPAVVAVDGPAGSGKSTLAVRAAHELADRFPDGQLYADLQGAVPTLSVLCSFLRALGGRELSTVDEAAARFRELTAGRRLLVVLDNARDAGQVRPLVPAAPGSAVLVTSRRVLALLDGAAAVHLDVLSAGEAVTLLGRLAGADRVAADPAAAAEVARLCGYLPLALRIAGARLAARPTWPVRALADRLAGAHRRLDELRVGELGVRASFQTSLHAVDPLAARTFALVALLDGPDLGVPAAARLLDEPEVVAEAALERLVDAQLLANPAPGRYALPDLLRLFAEECAEEQLRLRLLRPGHRHGTVSTVDSSVRPGQASAGSAGRAPAAGLGSLGG
jgi:DNA-binding SARP family transcriptional activator